MARDGQGQTTGWFTIATSSQNGQFQGSLPTTGGWYNVEVRAVAENGQSGAAMIERVGVGEVFLISGHSVAQGQDLNLGGSDDDRVNTAPVLPGTQTYADYERTANQDYLPRNFSHYSSGVAPAPFAHGTYFWAKTGQYLAQRLNVPILIFNAGFGGTNLEQWAKSALGQQFDHPFVNSSIGMPYRNVRNAIELYIRQTGIRGILSDHGQNDWANTNEDQVLQYYQTWVNQARSDLNFPSLAVVVNRKTPFNNAPVIRRVQERMSRLENSFPGPDYDLLSASDFSDGIHLSWSGTEKAARYWSDALNDAFFANARPYVLTALSSAQPVDENPPTDPGNQPPVAPTVSALSATVNSFYTSPALPHFTDPNNDRLTYSLTGLPAGLNFDSGTRIISGTPSQQGTFTLTYTADDEKVRSSVNVTLTVNGGTTAPAANFDGYLTQEANCSTLSGWAFNRNEVNAHVTIDFFEGPSIAAGVPIGSILASSFRQHLKDAGKGNGEHWFDFPILESLKDNQRHTIWARVQGSEFVLKWAPKTIQCAGSGTPPPTGNAAPVAPALSPLSATINVELPTTVLAAFTDAENDPLTYTLTGLPEGLSFNASNRTLSGTPRNSGSFTLTYAAKDPTHAPVSVSFSLIVAPADGGPGPIVSGNFDGYLDGVNCNSLSGWVWDRDKPNTPITVEFLDGATVATAVSFGTVVADIYRDDLKNAGKGNGAHGYSFATPEHLKDNQRHTIWARVQGSEFVLKWAPKTIQCAGSGTPPPAGNAAPVAPALSPLSATINVELPTTVLAAFTDAENDPLTYTLTGLPEGLSFNANNRTLSGTPRNSSTFTLTYAAKDPTHAPVAVTLLLTVGTDTGTPPPANGGSGPGNYEGFLDVVECSSIGGWVWDRNRPTTPIRVEFVEGNTVIGSTEANIYRDDLKNAGKGNGVHGYSFEVPASLKDGQPHSISGRVPGSNYTLKWSPKGLVCPSGARKGVESAALNFVNVSPNPSKGQTQIQYRINTGQQGEIHVIDIMGRSVWKKSVIGTSKTEHETIDLSAFGADNYLIQLQTDQQIFFKRLLINR
ncbi:putative Ig domain-containing protein [Larkinella arboricola]|uniref:putative Ig domain-containing protein n=1 Tax=Larkinella arboricola TaxID=643671 RepID=UPI0014750914|nr:putative Ig domain-containing protein [Larkinella arboricola]